jgi:S-adenosylmethionine:tRNA ribosyltransferase-isomerase
VYATRGGSVAAPTAGLHFTPDLLQQLAEQGIAQGYVSLHVGRATFRPMEGGSLEAHRMHGEWGSVDESTVELQREVRQRGRRIVAVGTTTTRILETAMGPEGPRAWTGITELFIRPPYEFRAIDALLTNFHLPCSTLLVLVSTFAGLEFVRRAYRVAIDEQYRFFSYGDAMLIL